MDPGFEALRVPQVREPAPGKDEGVLQRVLCERLIAQDALGHREQRSTYLVHQDGERVAITLASLLDELSLHRGLQQPLHAEADYPL